MLNKKISRSGINVAFYEPKIYINVTLILFC